MTTEMLEAPTFGALSISARRNLDFLMAEHTHHAGTENGRLAAPYLQLERFGVTKADIRKGLAELEATGFIRLMKQGLRQAGGGEPSRWALTWLPTGRQREVEPTQDWKRMLILLRNDGVKTVREARKWLRHEVDRSRGPRRVGGARCRAGGSSTPRPDGCATSKAPPPGRYPSSTASKGAPARDIEGAPHLSPKDRSHVRGKACGRVIPIKPHLRGGAVGE
jgi:hypothetical protein